MHGTPTQTAAIQLDRDDLTPGVLTLQEAAREVTLGGSRSVVVDVSRLDRLPSTLIAALIRSSRRCRVRGGSVVLHGAQPSVVDQLVRTGLAPLVERTGSGWGETRVRELLPAPRRAPQSLVEEATVGSWHIAQRAHEPGRVDRQMTAKGVRLVVQDVEQMGEPDDPGRPGSALVVLLRPGGHAFVTATAAPPAIHLPGAAPARRVPAAEPSSGDTVLLREDDVLLLCSPAYLHDPPEPLRRLRSAVEAPRRDLADLLDDERPGAVALVRRMA